MIKSVKLINNNKYSVVAERGKRTMTKKAKNLIIGLVSGLTTFFAAVGAVSAFIYIIKKASTLLKVIK